MAVDLVNGACPLRRLPGSPALGDQGGSWCVSWAVGDGGFAAGNDGFEKEVIVGLDRRHQMGIAGDQNDKNALAWVAGLVRISTMSSRSPEEPAAWSKLLAWPALHGHQPLCCLPSPARVHRRADAHEPHRPNPDAQGAPRTPQPRPRAGRDPPDPGKRMVGPGSPSTASPPMAMATTTGSAATS